MAYSLQEAIEKAPEEDESFVIGGGMVYRQFLEVADRLYITRVHKSFEADTFFPEIDPEVWELIEEITMPPDGENDFSFSYLTYIRRSKKA
jgi:dihydrofolate reductase